MVSTAAVVLVLLQLHVSDTLREENEEVQTPPYRMPSAHQSANMAKVPGSLNQPKKGIFREDEDLLDLMVRIAETPAEWERIHKVLSQLGAEKTSKERLQEEPNEVKKSDLGAVSNNTQNYNSTIQLNDSLKRNVLLNNSHIVQTKSTSISTPVFAETTTTLENDYQNDQFEDGKKEDNTETGWPDFDDAIVKKIKKSHTVSKENHILENDWFGDEWFDSNWNNFLNEQNEKSYNSPEINLNYPPVSFKTNQNKDRVDILNSNNVVKSKLYSDPKILELPLKEVLSTQNQTANLNILADSGEGSNRTSRPMFLYHRVTTSPQERKGNSAFIAVSVVKQNPLEVSSTSEAPEKGVENEQDAPWSPRFQRIQDQLESPADDKPLRKHPHWGNWAHPHHNRGHRHHRTHTHMHTHSHP